MNNQRFKTIMSIVAAFFLVAFFIDMSFAKAKKRVFIVHSYGKGHICGQPQHDGILKAFEDNGWVAGRDFELGVYYMATKKINNTPELIAEQAQIALGKIAEFQPDVVLILDDNAFRTVGLPLSGKQVAVVFCGLNVQPEDYNRIQPFMKDRLHPGGNITGIYEKLHIREAIKVLASMHDIKKFLFLDDLSPTGKAIAKQVDLEINSEECAGPLPCETEQATMHSWEEYQQTIEAINKSDEIGAFYLGALLLKDAAGNSYTAAEIIPYTVEHAIKPTLAPNYAFIKLGLFGGLSVDFYAMGKQAGLKVVQILSGLDPGTLSIDDARKVALVFNLTRAEKLGIEIPSDILLAADEVFRK